MPSTRIRVCLLKSGNNEFVDGEDGDDDDDDDGGGGGDGDDDVVWFSDGRSSLASTYTPSSPRLIYLVGKLVPPLLQFLPIRADVTLSQN